MNKRRLLDVAKDLRKAHRSARLRKAFDMLTFGHSCGTPACALGHYAAAAHSGSPFSLDAQGDLQVRGGFIYDAAKEWFGLSGFRVDVLFGEYGCGGAKTPLQAAKFIERFAATGGEP